MDADVVIVGGGLSGLAATWQLHRHGINVRLLEARQRTGGRVLSIPLGDSWFDYGPSWVWRGQPHVAGILKHFEIGVYEQVCDGDLLQQTADGVILWRRFAELISRHAIASGSTRMKPDAIAWRLMTFKKFTAFP